MHIGILQTGHFPDALLAEFGDYDAIFARLLGGRGLTFSAWPVVDQHYPDGVSDAEGWLITGSRHGAYDNLPWIGWLEDFIRTAYAARIPMVGICFGHQIVAQALGGKVEKFAGGWAVGHQTYDWGGHDITLNAWHQDQVVERPAGARVIASHPFCENAALVYDDRIFTVQAHPEFGAGELGALIDTRGPGVIPAPQLAAARASLSGPIDSAAVADQIAAFFRGAGNG